MRRAEEPERLQECHVAAQFPDAGDAYNTPAFEQYQAGIDLLAALKLARTKASPPSDRHEGEPEPAPVGSREA